MSATDTAAKGADILKEARAKAAAMIRNLLRRGKPEGPVPPGTPKGMRRADQEFLPAALEILERPPAPAARAMVAFICSVVVVAVGWSWFSHIDIVAVGSGKVQPSGRVKTVQAFEPGRVSRISAVNGTHVRAGDELVALEADDALQDVRAMEAAWASAVAEVARRTENVAAAGMADITISPVAWPASVPEAIRRREEGVRQGELGALAAQVAAIKAQHRQKQAERMRLVESINAQSALIAVQTERVDMRSVLAESKSGSRASLIDAAEALAQQRVNLVNQKGQLRETEQAIEALEVEERRIRSAFVSEQAVKIGEAERSADEFSARLAKARLKLERLTLKSPVDGVVHGSSVTSIGQVLTGGQEAMRIVPSGKDLEIEIYLPNKDIGFIQEGQDAAIKVEALPFTRYGTIPAKVARVARDAVPEADARQIEADPTRAAELRQVAGAQRVQGLVFPVTLIAERTTLDVDGRTVELMPGMTVAAEIKTGHRRILEYLFAPLVETVSRSAKER